MVASWQYLNAVSTAPAAGGGLLQLQLRHSFTWSSVHHHAGLRTVVELQMFVGCTICSWIWQRLTSIMEEGEDVFETGQLAVDTIEVEYMIAP